MSKPVLIPALDRNDQPAYPMAGEVIVFRPDPNHRGHTLHGLVTKVVLTSGPDGAQARVRVLAERCPTQAETYLGHPRWKKTATDLADPDWVHARDFNGATESDRVPPAHKPSGAA